MWIALFFIGLWAWISRKRKRKQQAAKTILILIFFLVGSHAFSQTFTLSGEISTTGEKGKIVIFLVDEEMFKTPLTGLDTFIVNPENGKTHFEFKELPSGEYAIRCYQDVNGNAKLDKGMFGPTEPYGFNWQTAKHFPFSFSDIAFNLNNNMNINIKLED